MMFGRELCLKTDVYRANERHDERALGREARLVVRQLQRYLQKTKTKGKYIYMSGTRVNDEIQVFSDFQIIF